MSIRKYILGTVVLASCAALLYGGYSAYAASGLDSDVKLLLRGNPGDNIVTQLRDSSFSNQTVTLNGNAVSASDKFSQSGFFDGNGDYLSVADAALTELGNSDFTIDFWMYLPTVSGDKYIFAKRTSIATYAPFSAYVSGSTMYIYASASGSSWDVASNRSVATGLTANRWHHVAFVRSGSTIYTFVNGAQTDSFSTSATLFNNSEAWTLAGTATATYFFTGGLDEFRMSIGTARWTSSFTPPTSPYTSDGSTSLLLHMDGTPGSTTFTDSSGSPKTVTANGNAMIGSFSKFGGSGISFDGNGDYLSITANNDFAFGTGDFTIDAWIRLGTTGAIQYIYSGGTTGAGLYVNSSNKLVYEQNNVAAYIIGGTSLSAGIWYHAAAARSGGQTKLFLNGVQESSTATESSNYTQNAPVVGMRPGIGNYINGSIDELRVSKGVARWTSNFTPPTEAYGVSGTTLTGNVKFLRNIAVVNNLSKGGGTFVIDHPQKPRTHLLYHSFVESPDVKNIYDGIVTLDSSGEAVIRLPHYFEALNKDFRYQFFPLAEAMPNLYIKEKVEDNQFVIAGGVPGGTVSWQVTGIRHDPYIQANPIEVEVMKGPNEIVNKGECVYEPLCQ